MDGRIRVFINERFNEEIKDDYDLEEIVNKDTE